MIPSFQAEIRIPAKPAFLPVALNFAEGVARAAELTESEENFTTLAAEEACSNAIEHAYAPQEDGDVRLVIDADSRRITLSLFDQGLPFDFSLAPKYAAPADSAQDAAGARGLGLFLIEKIVDTVEWINHGMAGKELRMTIKRAGRDVTDHWSEKDLSPYSETMPQVTGQSYHVRRMRPEDALEASRCIYRTYGYSYENDTAYFPDQLISQNRQGELFSFVAVDPEGGVVGYMEFKYIASRRMADLSQAVVIPAHRGRNVLGLLGSAVYAEMLKMNLLAVYSRLTTVHTFSQKESDPFACPCAITLAYVPRTRLYKGLETHVHDERKTLILYYHYFAAPAETLVYAPPRHRDILERIYRLLGARPLFMQKPAGDPPEAKMAVAYNRGAQTATLTVETAAPGAAVEIRRALHDLRDIAGAEAIYLLLPLAQPATPDLCRDAEAMGFFFSGVEPSFAPDGDYLRLQYLHCAIDFDHIQLYHPFGHELLSYIQKEKQLFAPGGEQG